MKIEFSPHAARQLGERNISIKEAEKILKHPDQIIKGRDKDREIAQKIILKNKKRFLYRVIYKKENSSCMVITAYRTTKIKKYFKEGSYES